MMDKKFILALFFILLLSSIAQAQPFGCEYYGTCGQGGGSGVDEPPPCPDCDCAPYENVCDCGACSTNYETVDPTLLPAELIGNVPVSRINEVINDLSSDQLAGLNNEQMDEALFEMEDLSTFSENEDAAEKLKGYFDETYGFEFEIESEEGITLTQEDDKVFITNNEVEFHIPDKELEAFEGVVAYTDGDLHGFRVINGEDSLGIVGVEEISLAPPDEHGEGHFMVDGMILSGLEGDSEFKLDDGDVLANGAEVQVGDDFFSGDVKFSIKQGSRYVETVEGPAVINQFGVDLSQPIFTRSEDSYFCMDDNSKCARSSEGADTVAVCIQCADTELEDFDDLIEREIIDGYVYWDLTPNALGVFGETAVIRGHVTANLYTDGPIVKGLHTDMVFEYRDDGHTDDIEFKFLGRTEDGEEVGYLYIYGKEVSIKNEDLYLGSYEQTLHVYDLVVAEIDSWSNHIMMAELFDTYGDELDYETHSDFIRGFYQFREVSSSCMSIPGNTHDDCEEQISNAFGDAFYDLFSHYNLEAYGDQTPPASKQIFMHHDTKILDEDGFPIDVENFYVHKDHRLLLEQISSHNLFREYLDNSNLAKAFQDANELGIPEDEVDNWVEGRMSLTSRLSDFEEERHYLNGYIEHTISEGFPPSEWIKGALYDQEGAYERIKTVNDQVTGGKLIIDMQTNNDNPLNLAQINILHGGNSYIQAAMSDPGMRADVIDSYITNGIPGIVEIGGKNFDLEANPKAAATAARLEAAKQYSELGLYDRAHLEFSRLIFAAHYDVQNSEGNEVVDLIFDNFDKIYMDEEGIIKYPYEIQSLIDQGKIHEDLLRDMHLNHAESVRVQRVDFVKNMLSSQLPDSWTELGINHLTEGMGIADDVVDTTRAWRAFRRGQVGFGALTTMTGFALVSSASALMLGVGGWKPNMADNVALHVDDVVKLRFGNNLDEGWEVSRILDEGEDSFVLLVKDGKSHRVKVGSDDFFKLFDDNPFLVGRVGSLYETGALNSGQLRGVLDELYSNNPTGKYFVGDMVHEYKKALDSSDIVLGPTSHGLFFDDQLDHLIKSFGLSPGSSSGHTITAREVAALKNFIEELEELGFDENQVQLMTESLLFQHAASAANQYGDHGIDHLTDDFVGALQVLEATGQEVTDEQKRLLAISAVFHDIGYSSDIVKIGTPNPEEIAIGIIHSDKHCELGACFLEQQDIRDIIKPLLSDDPTKAQQEMDFIIRVSREHGDFSRTLSDKDGEDLLLAAFGVADDTSPNKITALLENQERFELLTQLSNAEPQHKVKIYGDLYKTCGGDPLCMEAIDRANPATLSFNAPKLAVSSDVRYEYTDTGILEVHIDISEEAVKDLNDRGVIIKPHADIILPKDGAINPWARDFENPCPPNAAAGCVGARDDGVLLFIDKTDLSPCETLLATSYGC